MGLLVCIGGGMKCLNLRLRHKSPGLRPAGALIHCSRNNCFSPLPEAVCQLFLCPAIGLAAIWVIGKFVVRAFIEYNYANVYFSLLFFAVPCFGASFFVDSCVLFD